MKEMKISIQARFEDYNQGRASQKSLRTVPPIRNRDTVYISFFETKSCMSNVVLLTIYKIKI